MKSIINGVILENANIDNWKKKDYIYEVLRVIDNKPLFLKEHLIRLKKSVKDIDIDNIEKNLKKLIENLEVVLNNNIFISVNMENHDNGIFIIEGFYPPRKWYEKGIKINTFEIKRNNPNKKIYDINYKEKIAKHLKQTQVFETLIKDEGIINEGSRSNVFFIKDNVLYTPSLETVLPGITRDKVFEAAKKVNIIIIESSIKSCELNKFEGAFITGTSIDLLPIRQIDDIEYRTTALECFVKLSTNFESIKSKDLEIINVK